MERQLIEQALAIVEKAQPVEAGDEIPLDLRQTLVYTPYLAARERDAGRGSEADVREAVSRARALGIPEQDLRAAFAAAAGE